MIFLHFKPVMRLVILLLILVPGISSAQRKEGQARLDSLLAAARGIQEDTSGVRLLSAISREYLQINPVEGLRYAEHMLVVTRRIGWEKGEASALNLIGQHHSQQGDYPRALDYLFRALALHEQQHNDYGIASANVHIGHVYWEQRNSAKALEYHRKALGISERQGDSAMMLVALVHIGGDYTQQQQYEEALPYYRRSLDIALVLNIQSSISAGYSNVGDMYMIMKRYPEALAYKFRALRTEQALGNRRSAANITAGIGLVYGAIGSDSLSVESDSLIPAGKPANLALAEQYLLKALRQADTLHFTSVVAACATSLSALYEQRADYKQALAYHQLAGIMEDSMFSSEKSAAIAAMETKRAVELKEKDVQIARLALQRKQQLTWLLIGGLVLMAAAAGLLLRSYRRQQHFNSMLANEKRRSDELLLNILPAEVAEELKSQGAMAARRFDAVSVLFTDFADFTNIAEQLTPEALVQELHECFTAFDAIIERHGLEKIKTIGDAYMAVCGLPHADHRHARKAVQAAIDIRDFVETRHRDEQHHASAFRIRIGINSGQVVAGIVGVKKFAYDIWGDAVNIAARMEQSGEPGRINISQSTYELVRDAYHCTYRGKIAAKNKGEIAMYFVEGRIRPA